MIKAECKENGCAVELTGTASTIAKETAVMVQAIFNGVCEAMPKQVHTTYGNIYRLCILKALTECTPNGKDE